MNELESYFKELPEIDKLYLAKKTCSLYKDYVDKEGSKQFTLKNGEIVLLLRIEEATELEKIPQLFHHVTEPEYFKFIYLVGKEEKYHFSSVNGFKRNFIELDKAYANNSLYY